MHIKYKKMQCTYSSFKESSLFIIIDYYIKYKSGLYKAYFSLNASLKYGM